MIFDKPENVWNCDNCRKEASALFFMRDSVLQHRFCSDCSSAANLYYKGEAETSYSRVVNVRDGVVFREVERIYPKGRIEYDWTDQAKLCLYRL